MSTVSTGLSRHELGLVVRPDKAAVLLDVSRGQIYRLLNRKELESYNDGRARRITVASIDRFIEKRIAAARQS